MKSSVTMQVKPLAKSSSSKQVKAKFFNTLGIGPSQKTLDDFQSSNHQYLENEKRYHHPRENVVFSNEELKYNREEELPLPTQGRWGFLMKQNSESVIDVSEEQSQKKDGVSFVDTVSVRPIPKRDEYSDRVAKRIWNSAHEIQEMAMRNSVEFAAEGWDWRTVTEDEKMFQCRVSGELIHPVHFQSD